MYICYFLCFRKRKAQNPLSSPLFVSAMFPSAFPKHLQFSSLASFFWNIASFSLSSVASSSFWFILYPFLRSVSVASKLVSVQFDIEAEQQPKQESICSIAKFGSIGWLSGWSFLLEACSFFEILPLELVPFSVIHCALSIWLHCNLKLLLLWVVAELGGWLLDMEEQKSRLGSASSVVIHAELQLEVRVYSFY